jgi:hypothetical protein
MGRFPERDGRGTRRPPTAEGPEGEAAFWVLRGYDRPLDDGDGEGGNGERLRLSAVECDLILEALTAACVSSACKVGDRNLDADIRRGYELRLRLLEDLRKLFAGAGFDVRRSQRRWFPFST